MILGILKERTASIDVGDIDNDRDEDLLVANGRHWPGQNRVFLNNGDRLFTISRPLDSQLFFILGVWRVAIVADLKLSIRFLEYKIYGTTWQKRIY